MYSSFHGGRCGWMCVCVRPNPSQSNNSCKQKCNLRCTIISSCSEHALQMLSNGMPCMESSSHISISHCDCLWIVSVGWCNAKWTAGTCEHCQWLCVLLECRCCRTMIASKLFSNEFHSKAHPFSLRQYWNELSAFWLQSWWNAFIQKK